MAFDKDAFLTALDGMSVMELNDLVKAIEEKFGVSAAAMAAPAAGGGGAAAAAVEEKTEFNVVLLEAGANKVVGHQGRARNDRPGPEGSQGPGRRRSEARQGSHRQGRRRSRLKKLVEAGAKAEISNSTRGRAGSRNRAPSLSRFRVAWSLSPLESTCRRIRRQLQGFRQVFSDPTAEKRVWSGSGAMPGLSASGW